MTSEKLSFMGWPNCLRLSNGRAELIIATDIGLRILRFGFIGEQNLLHLEPAQAGTTGGNDWRLYGGHRLWHSPEAMPRSYCPDNDPVQYTNIEGGIRITQPTEHTTGIQKEMDITLSENDNYLRVLHRLYNRTLWPVELAPWAISALTAGGLAVIPQEPFGTADECLLPVRTIALWPFTRINDPRWTWGDKYIFARHDPAQKSEQKIGVTNTLRWMAYCVGSDVLIKSFDYHSAALYPDLQSNMEVYIDGRFLELETLGPLAAILPGASAEHTEHWFLDKMPRPENEKDVDEMLLQKVDALLARSDR